MHTHTHACTHTHIHIHTRTHACTHARAHTHTHSDKTELELIWALWLKQRPVLYHNTAINVLVPSWSASEPSLIAYRWCLSLSLAGSATSIIFVMTVFLWSFSWQKFCHDKNDTCGSSCQWCESYILLCQAPSLLHQLGMFVCYD